MTLLTSAVVLAACGPPFFLFLTWVAAAASGRPLSPERLRRASLAGVPLVLFPMVVIIVAWPRTLRFLVLLVIGAGLLWALAWSALATASLRVLRRARVRREH